MTAIKPGDELVWCYGNNYKRDYPNPLTCVRYSSDDDSDEELTKDPTDEDEPMLRTAKTYRKNVIASSDDDSDEELTNGYKYPTDEDEPMLRTAKTYRKNVIASSDDDSDEELMIADEDSTDEDEPIPRTTKTYRKNVIASSDEESDNDETSYDDDIIYLFTKNVNVNKRRSDIDIIDLTTRARNWYIE